MKHRLFVMVILAIVLAFATVSWAKPVEISGKIEQKIEKIGKNGSPYVRFIIPVVGKTESGVAYVQSLPFMAFGALVTDAKLYKEGQVLKCVAEMRYFNGRQSYTILKFVK
jgi:hypothetical protein